MTRRLSRQNIVPANENVLISGFGGIAPPASIIHERPSYGGTCYSDFTSNQWLTVTEYNGQSVVGTKTWSQSTSGQVYAHVIDGLVSQEVLQTSVRLLGQYETTASVLISQI